MNTATTEAIRALHEINEYGLETAPRDQKVRELTDFSFNIDPVAPIPHYGKRPANFRYTAGEFAWYLMGERNIEFIKNFSNFWNRIADENGEINSNYGNLILGDQFKWAHDSLVKDKDTRQAVMFFNQPKFQYEGNKDFVCTMYVNFWIREDNLYMMTNMRSQDLFYGYTYDIPWFTLVMQNMYLLLKEHYPDLELGVYKHRCDNVHYYERHFDVAESILAQDSYEAYSMELKEPLFDSSGKMLPFGQAYIDLVTEKSPQAKDISHEEWKEIIETICTVRLRKGMFTK